MAYEFSGLRVDSNAAVEVRRHAISEPRRLADVKQVATLIAHQVDARALRQCGYDLGRYVPLDSAAGVPAMLPVEQTVEPVKPHPGCDFDENREQLSRHPRVAESSVTPLGR